MQSSNALGPFSLYSSLPLLFALGVAAVPNPQARTSSTAAAAGATTYPASGGADTTYTPTGGSYQGSGQVLFEITNAKGTTYYDISESTDGDPCGVGGVVGTDKWAVSSGINDGSPPSCSDLSGRKLDDLGSAQIVALDNRLTGGNSAVPANLAYWCGKEVRIYDHTGMQIVLDVGPFYLWDGCLECTQTHRADFSASGLTAINGGTCANAEGITVQVIDNQIVQPESTTAETPESTSLALTAGAYNNVDAAMTVSAPAASLLGLSTRTVTVSGITAVSAQSAPYAGTVSQGAATDATSVAASQAVGSTRAEATGVATSTAVAAMGTTAPAGATTAGPGATTTTAGAGTSKQGSVLTVAVAENIAETSLKASAAAAGSSSAAADDGCAAAAYQCQGLSLQVCGFTSNGTAWEDMAACPTTCTVNSTTVECV